MIQRRPGTALYVALAEHLRGRIERGDLAPGMRVPAITALTQEHDVSRETVTRALAILRAEGLLEVELGRGTRVRRPAEAGDRSVVTIQRYARWELRMPTPAERAELDIPEGVPVMDVQVGTRRMIYPGDRFTFQSK